MIGSIVAEDYNPSSGAASTRVATHYVDGLPAQHVAQQQRHVLIVGLVTTIEYRTYTLADPHRFTVTVLTPGGTPATYSCFAPGKIYAEYWYSFPLHKDQQAIVCCGHESYTLPVPEIRLNAATTQQGGR